MNKLKILSFIIISSLSVKLFAADFKVRIFSQSNIKSTIITSLVGKYIINGNDNSIGGIEKSENVTITIEKNKLRIKKGNEDLGLFNTLEIAGDGLKNIFKIKPSNQDLHERIYDDDIDISIEKGFLKIINNVDIEHYVAGVVQSEILGSCDSLEFFKIQAIISRTYAINNMMKHYKEGFNLCDDVHCQVYKSRCNNFQILMATTLTAGDVIVDKNKRMISAAFCSNSGGETINSEELWSIPTTYLKAVVDTFSNGMRNSSWEKKMPAREWLNYLKDTYNYPVGDTLMHRKAFDFDQSTRKIYFHDSIPLKNIRKDLELKSAFFSVKKDGDYVILKGKGYGHGVGLSQEGAIKMVRYRFTANQIIKFYYKDVDIVNYEVIKKID
ncbi:MAG: SpoIID/LytB domain-containing protein [Bacteroidetes bacterium]|nr:SpoIID/LytB domain-containing protein [Bacteroidota bacterium]